MLSEAGLKVIHARWMHEAGEWSGEGWPAAWTEGLKEPIIAADYYRVSHKEMVGLGKRAGDGNVGFAQV